MATYIPGITDYIPQFQPFTPDYNFLGNILEQRQSKYDQNYEALSRTYGSLLNSPMLRDENIQKKQEFFKMIDQDIKKMSGMDLSLQQNVDAANKVFNSFFENKNMVKDMMFTKEYHRQLGVAEGYKNCIDQDKCGGKYWETGVKALHHRAQEFKNGSWDEVSNMSVGEYAPMINLQEKAMKYASEFLGKNGFGISKMDWTKDGNYQVTMKNGALLQVPLQQLLLNQYGKDQSIINMFRTEAYVARKDFIETNKQLYGGDENLAEDAYFEQIDAYAAEQEEMLKKVQEQLTGTQLKKEILEKRIREEGVAEGDDLGIDFAAAGIDLSYASETAEIVEEQTKLARSVYDEGIDRKTKRARIDGMIANSQMQTQIMGAANGVAALTGSIEYKEDPYAKGLFDFSLDMKKIQAQADLQDRNNMRQAQYEMAKEQALMDYITGGDLASAGTTGVPVGSGGGSPTDGYLGTATANTIDEMELIQSKTLDATHNLNSAYGGWVSEFAKDLVNTATRGSDAAERQHAELTLRKWLGDASKEGQGYANGRFHVKTSQGVQTFDINTATGFVKALEQHNPGKLREIYSSAKGVVKTDRSIPVIDKFMKTKGKFMDDVVFNSENLVEAVEGTLSQNLANVRQYMLTNSDFLEESEHQLFKQMFTESGGKVRLKTEEQFIKDITSQNMVTPRSPGWETAAGVAGGAQGGVIGSLFGWPGAIAGAVGGAYGASSLVRPEAASEMYSRLLGKIHNTYNSSPNGVTALYANGAFGGKGGGAAGMSMQYDFNTQEFRKHAYMGSLTYLKDFENSVNGIAYAGKPVVDTDNIPGESDDPALQMAISAFRDELMGAPMEWMAKKKSFVGKNFTVAYQDVSLSNNEMTGLYVKPTGEWLDEVFTGKENKKLLEANPQLRQGFTLHVPKSEAKNQFTVAHQRQPYDLILQHKDVTLESPNAGRVTIGKAGSDGSHEITLQPKYFENGKLMTPKDATVFTVGPGGQNVFNEFKAMMDQLEQANTEFLETGRSRSFNPDALFNDPNRQVTPGELFQRNLQRNMGGNY